MNILIDIFPLALIPLFLCGCSFARGKGHFHDDYLSPETGRAERGFFAVTVILHHISQQTASGLLLPRFLYVGNLPVSVFFFLSGYGLIKQLSRNRDYGRKVLKKRIPAMLLPFACVIAAVTLLYALMGDPRSPLELVAYVFTGDIFLCILWYFAVITVFYLLFGLLSLLLHGDVRRTALAMLACCVLYTLLLFRSGAGEWLYNTCHLLIIGMLWAVYEKELLRFIDRWYYPLMLLCLTLFCLIFTGYDRFFPSPTPAVHLAVALVRNAAFSLGFILVTRKLKPGNAVLRFLGDISLELYAVQVAVLKLFHCDLCCVGNDLAYAFLVLAVTILLSYLIRTIKKRI